jgi:hypothetical protein|eukprot:SAG25_NODE_193_length_12184_cov_5.527844_11_plen_259_part_00
MWLRFPVASSLASRAYCCRRSMMLIVAVVAAGNWAQPAQCKVLWSADRGHGLDNETARAPRSALPLAGFCPACDLQPTGPSSCSLDAAHSGWSARPHTRTRPVTMPQGEWEQYDPQDWYGFDIQPCLASGCTELRLNNERCDEVCNNLECGYDLGYCFKFYDYHGYGWDFKGCEQAGCRRALLFNDECNPECNSEICHYDNWRCFTNDKVRSMSCICPRELLHAPRWPGCWAVSGTMSSSLFRAPVVPAVRSNGSRLG